MTLPSSGELRFSDIQEEFQLYGSSDRLSDYYRGGGIVPDTFHNRNIPASGPLRVRDFLGAESLVVTGGTFSTTGITLNTGEFTVATGAGAVTWVVETYPGLNMLYATFNETSRTATSITGSITAARASGSELGFGVVYFIASGGGKTSSIFRNLFILRP